MVDKGRTVWTLEGGFQSVGGGASAGQGVRPGVAAPGGRWNRHVVPDAGEAQRAWRRAVLKVRIMRVVFGAELVAVTAGTVGERSVVPVLLVFAIPTALAWAYTEVEAFAARYERRAAARRAALGRAAPADRR